MKDAKMVLAKLVANQASSWSFEEIARIFGEMGYRNPESQIRPFIIKLREMKEMHALFIIADRFAGQYKSLKGDARQLIGSLDNLRDAVTPNVEVTD